MSNVTVHIAKAAELALRGTSLQIASSECVLMVTLQPG